MPKLELTVFTRGEGAVLAKGQWIARDKLGDATVLDFVIACPLCAHPMILGNDHAISRNGCVTPAMKCSRPEPCSWATQSAVLHAFEFDGKPLGITMVGRMKE